MYNLEESTTFLEGCQGLRAFNKSCKFCAKPLDKTHAVCYPLYGSRSGPAATDPMPKAYPGEDFYIQLRAAQHLMNNDRDRKFETGDSDSLLQITLDHCFSCSKFKLCVLVGTTDDETFLKHACVKCISKIAELMI